MQSHSMALVLLGILAAVPALNAQTSPAEAGRQTATPQQQSQAPPQSAAESKLTFEGDTALWTVAIRTDKTADFERVMQRLREALMKSGDPARQRQAEGWKVVRLSMPLPDGNIAYVHVVNPVVPGADYTVMQILYDAFPDERQMLYELYRGAFASNLALATGNVAVDLGMRAPSVTPAPAAEMPTAPPASPTPPTPPNPPTAPTSPTAPASPTTPPGR